MMGRGVGTLTYGFHTRSCVVVDRVLRREDGASRLKTRS
jgi:hypothetical protein